ncbi:MAG: BACON domain-containing carbohydrate-binding protein, partial [Bacteroidales bacterium]|nr:BACON domain-containing carbohydrate-binding protein [Bacteroidales bacterium]
MKKSVKFLGVVAGMAALLASCNKQENPTGAEGKTIEMTIVASSDDTKTVLGSDGTVTWSASGEQLAVIEAAVSGTETTTAKVTSKDGVTTDEGATMSFGVSMTEKTADSFGYYALYPNSAYVEKPTDLAKVKVNLASTQAPTESSFGPSADVLVAKPVTGLTAQPKELNLQFARVIAVGKMTIKNLNTTENVQKVTFTATDKPVTGRSYINLTNATAVEYGYSDQGVYNVVLDYSGKEILADGMTAYFTCWPFSIAAGETFSVVVETENYTFTKDVTLAEGKSLTFNEGRATAFNVSFTDIDGVEKTPATQLVPDGVYVVAQGDKIMTVGTSTSYFGFDSKPAENEDKSITVYPNAAWKFAYDADSETYLISSMDDESKYVQGASNGNTLKLVAQTSATKFQISQNKDGSYRIGSISGSDARYIGYNTSAPRFAMYAGSSTQPVDLNLYTAKVVQLAEITVQGTLDLTADLAESSFPVSWKNVDLSYSFVDVYKDEACKIKEESWISVEFNEDKSAIKYTVLNNDTESERKAYIKVEAISVDGESEDSKVIVVTQAKAVPLTAYPYSESFAESQGDFTIENVTMPSPLTYVWKYTTYSGGNYMKASAYANKTNYATESWLISPVIDMSSAVNPALSFMTVARYGSNENLTLWAREKGG